MTQLLFHRYFATFLRKTCYIIHLLHKQASLKSQKTFRSEEKLLTRKFEFQKSVKFF
jgi:hypothetical protein